MINRLLDSITDSMVMYLSKLQETVEERGIWHAAIHGVEKSHTRLHNCACVLTRFSCVHSRYDYTGFYGGFRTSLEKEIATHSSMLA